MKKIILLALAIGLCTAAASAQSVKRTIIKTDRFDFGAGGTVVITGAPQGAIKITPSQRNEIEIVANIELQAASESDITKLAEITGFITTEDLGRTAIQTIGTHAKQLLKKAGKKIPKDLAKLPFRVDYEIKVPRYCDLEINGGIGDLIVQGVEGSMQINVVDSNAKIELISGAANIAVGKGSADVSLASRGWRGRSANIQLGTGDLTLHLPTNLSADIDAVVARSGKIENTFPDLKPRDRKVTFTDKSILAKAGVGGISLKFGVGDGTIRLMPLTTPL